MYTRALVDVSQGGQHRFPARPVTPLSNPDDAPATAPLYAYSDVDPHRIHYRHRDDLAPPDRVPVVLVHGYIVSGAYLDPTLRHLARDHPVYAPDLPGHGLSSKPEKALSVEEQADVLMRWAENVGLERMALIGNSLGCAIASAAAVAHPERVERLVMQGPAMQPEERDPLHSMVNGIKNIQQTAGTGFDRLMWNDYRKAGLKHTLEAWHWALEDRIEKRLPQIQVPTLVVHGENDPFATVDWAMRVARLLPDARFVLMPDADHVIVYNKAKEFCEIVGPFLQNTGPSLEVSTETGHHKK